MSKTKIEQIKKLPKWKRLGVSDYTLTPMDEDWFKNIDKKIGELIEVINKVLGVIEYGNHP